MVPASENNFHRFFYFTFRYTETCFCPNCDKKGFGIEKRAGDVLEVWDDDRMKSLRAPRGRSLVKVDGQLAIHCRCSGLNTKMMMMMMMVIVRAIRK